MFKAWFDLAADAALLGFEAQRVIGLRMVALGAGGAAAEAEGRRMVAEKASAMMEAATILATGGSAGAVVRRYRKHVRANEKRLSRS